LIETKNLKKTFYFFVICSYIRQTLIYITVIIFTKLKQYYSVNIVFRKSITNAKIMIEVQVFFLSFSCNQSTLNNSNP